ncbi:MAG TPA: DUF3780 domain-containing protein [Acidimicrobiales bacterium]|nr:DUF3780 domain-containing protein [Acidimicrobiales bacterium]
MAKRKARNTLGFGFDPAQSPHHFAVETKRDSGDITIVERFVWEEAPEAGDATPAPSPKASLDAYRWARVSPTVAEVFNTRLRVAGLATANWGGITQLAPHLGKELTLLAWAVEDADPTLLPSMLANWVGLAPEERWWLYSTINATSGHAEHGRDRGWRKAIKIAFAENPIAAAAPSALLSEAPVLAAKRQGRRRAAATLPSDEADQLKLF